MMSKKSPTNSYQGKTKVQNLVYLLIWTLFLGKAAFVHAVVYGIVDQIVDLIYGLLQMNRVEIQAGVLGDVVELGVEHADYLRALVVHHSLELLVPQNLQAVSTQ
jgi:hypothetical protein